MNIANLAAAIQSATPSRGRRVVGICGLGGAGKSTVTRRLIADGLLEGVAVQLDWYLRWPTPERRQRIADARGSGDKERLRVEENPLNWYDWARFMDDVKCLRRDGEVRVVGAWDQATGLKDRNITISCGADAFILCEGMYLLHDPVIQSVDLSVLITVPDAIARRRADQRDAHRSDPEYLAYKRHLVEVYDVPYFENYAPVADLTVELDEN